jgi:NADPH:quinone reductase-like Zn-dependent oxidoreductase
MMAVVQDGYGAPDALELRDIDPPAVADHEVLVRVRAASVNAADWHFMRGLPYVMRVVGAGMGFGLSGPKHRVRGLDVAGHVEAVGPGVRRLRPGDEVYGEGAGAFAELASVSEDALAVKPANLTFEEAAAMPVAAGTALHGLRAAGRIAPGQKVAVVGASGGVGTFALQLAKAFGAQVTAVCSTRHVEQARGLGADRVIDYTREDFTRRGARYDLVLNVAGARSPAELRRSLTPSGTLVLSSGDGGDWFGPLGRMVAAVALSPFVRQHLRPSAPKPGHESLEVLRELAERGAVAPVVERTYPLGEAPEAIRYVEQGHAAGKVVITV